MLQGSVRRVAAAAPHTPILSSIGSAASRPAVANITLTCRPLQQRRYSSSKPSRDNDSGDLPVNQSVQPSNVSKAAGAKSSGEKRKRKAKESPEEQQLPRVPSTQSIPNESLALSSFFSLHRPISVTHSLPRIVTDDAFAAIFAQRARAAKHSEVMSTISRTVHGLEQPMATLSVESDMNSHGPETDAGIHKLDMMHGDGPEAAVSVQVNSMSGGFLPFRPPPLPQPHSATGGTSEAKDAAGLAAVAEEDQQMQTRVYRAVFTIEESTDEHGDVKILAHSPELIEEPQQQHGEGGAAAPTPRTFLERMALRQMRYEDSRDHQQYVRNGSILAISVKRQRKLKMKKKKYKKLQKRLRHERRKLDR